MLQIEKLKVALQIHVTEGSMKGDAVKRIVEKKSKIKFHLVSPFVETERVLTDHCVHCVRL